MRERQTGYTDHKEASDIMTVVLKSALELVVDLIAELTTNFVCPGRFIKDKNVVCQYDDVKDLIGKKNMPALDLV